MHQHGLAGSACTAPRPEYPFVRGPLKDLANRPCLMRRALASQNAAEALTALMQRSLAAFGAEGPNRVCMGCVFG